MARIARVIAPGYPHHVTQRGNRCQTTFFCDKDYELYIELMEEWCEHFGVEIWAYVLMPNHVHLTAVPSSEEGLRRAIGDAHRRYTRHINFRYGWRGHLWQGRFFSCPMDEKHLLAAARYIELNPLRAGLVTKPWMYPWSSAAAHVNGLDNRLVRVAPLLEMIGDWRRFLSEEVSQAEVENIHLHERTGRPLGGDQFTRRLEQELKRFLGPRSRGPKPRSPGDAIISPRN